MTFEIGNTYILNDPDLTYFIPNTQSDTLPQNKTLIYNLLIDMKYNINTPGDKKSKGYDFIEVLKNQ